jgi:hypothetical protein
MYIAIMISTVIFPSVHTFLPSSGQASKANRPTATVREPERQSQPHRHRSEVGRDVVPVFAVAARPHDVTPTAPRRDRVYPGAGPP